MALVTNKEILLKAQRKKYAVGAFNINNLEFLKAVVATVEKNKSPAIIQATPSAIIYMGIDYLADMVKSAAKNSKSPISLHLDHGLNLNQVKECVKAGFTSVMFDGSHFKFEKNVKFSKKAVDFASRYGVSVEAELGTLAGIEDDVSHDKINFTNPEQAKDFVEKTGVDALAVAIGTSHGAYKFSGIQKLRIDILKEIKKNVDVPLVLHGASGVKKEVVSKANRYGARIIGAKGVPDIEIKAAIREGICKVNIDTDNRLAFTAGIRQFLHDKPYVFDPRKYLTSGMEEIEETVSQKISLFGSKNKA